MQAGLQPNPNKSTHPYTHPKPTDCKWFVCCSEDMLFGPHSAGHFILSINSGSKSFPVFICYLCPCLKALGRAAETHIPASPAPSAATMRSNIPAPALITANTFGDVAEKIK